ncbi:MAG: hypothetical protein ACK5KQ_03470 [Anaerorhabdus sp.]
MEKTMLFAIILSVIGILVLLTFYRISKKTQERKMLQAIYSTDFDTFFKVADSKFTRYVFPKFNLEYLKLNVHILKNDEPSIDESFEKMFKFKMNTPQKEDIYMKAFNYYVGMEKKEKTTQLIEVIETFDNEELKNEARIIYDIFVLKKSNYIDDMIEALPKQDINTKGVNEYLISVQYKNLNDNKNAKKYEALSKKHLNNKKSK